MFRALPLIPLWIIQTLRNLTDGEYESYRMPPLLFNCNGDWSLVVFLETMFYNLISTIQFAKGDDRMSFLDKTFQTHLDDIQKKMDKSTDQVLDEIYSDANESVG